MKSLFICGCCGKDTRKTDRDIEKVTLGGYANMLCPACNSTNTFRDSDGWWYCNMCGEIWEKKKEE